MTNIVFFILLVCFLIYNPMFGYVVILYHFFFRDTVKNIKRDPPDYIKNAYKRD